MTQHLIIITLIKTRGPALQEYWRVSGSLHVLFGLGEGFRPVLFVVFMDRISRHSLGVEQVRFGGLGIPSAVCR